MKARRSSSKKQVSDFADRFRAAFGGARDAEIARRLGYRSQSPLAKFINGESLPTGKVLVKIAQITKVDLHWLLTGEGDPEADPLSFLGQRLLHTLERVTNLRRLPIEEMMRHLMTKPLRERCQALLNKHPDLEPDELEQFKALTDHFRTVPDGIATDVSARRRSA